ncbi:SGNH/GDSL hydrolase family protein [Ornithinimicrobium cryptoxanthini]|uniref:SGNH/GDSL hydrolase family protein n=1 Tax=Ornithinimicrobium cryptoxanthini TaxID=2934161 RepID=A0ABY4YGW1_9MICO|nr:SGNH/GDSL hydrolase family protein [Ornithinimicrobium cryptoxanthini]USQ75500.1 SGNH/GDSL hydrolase family protein [Ornithinimicrobium cryptoxanthini]
MKPSRRTMTSLAAAVALLLPLTASATAAPPSFTYDAIGDSYAAGSGAPDGAAYPEVLNGRMRISLDDFAALPGATAGPSDKGLSSQLGALDEDTDLVTLTIGGNDIPWGATVTQCLALDDAICFGAIAEVEAQIQNQLPAILDSAYADVTNAAPSAHIVVTGYAHLFSPRSGDYTVPLTPEFTMRMSVAEQQAANDAADLLNQVIAERAAAHGFDFVDITKRFDGHGANAKQPWIHGFLPAALGDSFHPDARGYRAYATALTAGISPKDLRG